MKVTPLVTSMVAATVVIAPLAAAFGAPASDVAVVQQAEALSIAPTSAGLAIDNPMAEAGRELLIWSNGSTTWRFDGAATQVKIRMRGDYCKGWPQARISVNGTRQTINVSTNSHTEYVVAVPRSKATSSTVSVAFVNDLSNRSCDRNLFVDRISATVATTATPTTATPTKVTPTTATPTKVTPTTAAPTVAAASSRGAFSSTDRLWSRPDSRFAQQAQAWAASRPGDAAVMRRMATNSSALWLGQWQDDVAAVDQALASARGSMPVLVLYSIPQRDGGHYSSGGAADHAAYRAWVDRIAQRIGDRKAIVLVEPDATSMDVGSSTDQRMRWESLAYAIRSMKARPNTHVYLDAGTANWRSPRDVAGRLWSSGVLEADGFVVNISNFASDDAIMTYGTAVSALLGNKHFVIDTSRNGRGAWTPTGGETEPWCNPPGRAVGFEQSLNTGRPLVDAFLWVKIPGESDGACRGYPSAGTWMPEEALAMARAARW